MALDYQRYLFRLIRQEKSESFGSFVDRLRYQVAQCKFSNEEIHLKDQIIEKCNINELRAKAFQVELSLNQLIITGRTIEASLKNCSNEQPGTSRSFLTKDRKISCKRCGSKVHTTFDILCPALKEICSSCNRKGHLNSMCLSSIFKRKAAKDLSSDNPYGHLLLKKRPAVSFAPDTKVEKHFSAPENVIKREPGASDESSNVQRPNSSAPSSILVRTCKVGGRKAKLSVQFTSVSNVISKSLLRKLEAEKFKYFTYDMIPCKIGIMEFIGQVTSDIEINDKVVNFVFYVQEGNSDQVTINPKTARQLGL